MCNLFLSIGLLDLRFCFDGEFWVHIVSRVNVYLIVHSCGGLSMMLSMAIVW